MQLTHCICLHLVIIHWFLIKERKFYLRNDSMFLWMNGESSWCANICPRPRPTTCSNCLKLTIRIIFRTCNLQISLRPITSFQQGIKADSVDEQITNGSCMRITRGCFLSQFPCFALKYIEEGVKACLAACLSKFGAFEENKSAFLIFYPLVSPPCLV